MSMLIKPSLGCLEHLDVPTEPQHTLEPFVVSTVDYRRLTSQLAQHVFLNDTPGKSVWELLSHASAKINFQNDLEEHACKLRT